MTSKQVCRVIPRPSLLRDCALLDHESKADFQSMQRDIDCDYSAERFIDVIRKQHLAHQTLNLRRLQTVQTEAINIGGPAALAQILSNYVNHGNAKKLAQEYFAELGDKTAEAREFVGALNITPEQIMACAFGDKLEALMRLEKMKSDCFESISQMDKDLRGGQVEQKTALARTDRLSKSVGIRGVERAPARRANRHPQRVAAK